MPPAKNNTMQYHPSDNLNMNGYELEWDDDEQPRRPVLDLERGSNNSKNNDASLYTGPIDLDEFFSESFDHHQDDPVLLEDNALLVDDDDDEGATLDNTLNQQYNRVFDNPHKRLLDNDASLIPGSPFSKPPNRPSNRPTEPLALAKYASTLALLITVGWVAALFFFAIYNYNNIGRIIVECLLALLSFFGLFWNSYYIVSMFLKCFIPSRAFLRNTKYCSIVPERKPESAAWSNVTIQIPVYKESLHQVLRPTLKSCIAARDYYQSQQTDTATCNIVVCDDGMMSFLRDRFPAAEMLWTTICQTQGQVLKLSKLLKSHVPRESRRHLKGLNSKSVYEVFHRMLFYYHYNVGFVARSTVDRKGKFKKASNLNSHLRLALGAAQLVETNPDTTTFDSALHEYSHNPDGSCYVMYGGNVQVGDLICINDADARMAESVILKTVPEFLNDSSLGFTQHATKTLTEQRDESYYTKMLSVYTDTLYQGHFLLSSIFGCHPPLVGHSIFLRTQALKNCGRLRTLRKAQHWLKNIGLPFLPVDQIGFSNLQGDNKVEYWSEEHVSEDFELMIHLYNLGFNGRYCAYPNCEFQEGITRTFDEEAGRHRKFSLGAHELVFHPFQDMLGHGVFTGLFKTFMTCDIPSYYKVFLTAYLCSYTSGGTYIIVFTAAAIARILDDSESNTLYAFSPASVIVLNIIIFYVLGYLTLLISMSRMYLNNKLLLFREYRRKCGGICHLIVVMLRYCLVFQFLFYTVMNNWYFLGSMDHMLARPNVCSTTNKDQISSGRCVALFETIKFNSGSWFISAIIGCLAYATVLQDFNWDVTKQPTFEEWIQLALFSAPAVVLAVFSVVVPIILNPYILGWPFLRKKKPTKQRQPEKTVSFRPKRDKLGRKVVGLNTFMDTAKELDKEIDRAQRKEDGEIGSLATRDLKSQTSPEFSPKSFENLKTLKRYQEAEARGSSRGRGSGRDRMENIPEQRASYKPSSSARHHRSSRHGSSRRLGHIEDV